MEQERLEAPETEVLSAGSHEVSDRDLIAEVLRKDRKATAEFVARCADPVYSYVRHRLFPRADLVEDLVQEVFLAAWQSLDKFRGDSSLRSWMLGIARHKVEDHYRSQLRELPIGEEDEVEGDGPAGSYDLEEAIATRQAGQMARETLADLPESYALILLWRYWGRRSLREIALETGRTEKAIERLLARARSQFKKRWHERQSATRR
jgi:RNA polymerase sigma-70 factor (ECF subfamily)